MPLGSLWSASKSVPIEPEEYIDAGSDRVVLLHRLAAQGRGGISLERQDGIVYLLRDGKLVRMDYYGSQRIGGPPFLG